MAHPRGSIGFSTTYRPPVPLDIVSCSTDQRSWNEIPMTDEENYNYNGQMIPPRALKKIIRRIMDYSEKNEWCYYGNDYPQFSECDVDSGIVSGMIFVSERGKNLESLHIAVHFKNRRMRVYNFGDVYGISCGVCMEDSPCFTNDYIIYISTREPGQRRQPWTAVYKTHLITGETSRLTPIAEADLSPSVNNSRNKVAVASFQQKGGWDGEIEDLKTDIFVFNIDNPLNRKLVIENGGWPSWGSDNVIFFHRKVGNVWGVFKAYIRNDVVVKTDHVTPSNFHAMTPAAIDESTVAVATIRVKFDINLTDHRDVDQYRHIEIFSVRDRSSLQITKRTKPKADHFNPFIINSISGEERVGYHRCRNIGLDKDKRIINQSHELLSPVPGAGLFRVSGIFPTVSRDGSKLAFVDNEFKEVLLAHGNELTAIFKTKANNVFSPVWNQSEGKNKYILYINIGPSFQADKELNIFSLIEGSNGNWDLKQLTKGGGQNGFTTNNAFPSTNRDGTKFVFRSTRNGGKERFKHLYIMEDAQRGEIGGSEVRQLTFGNCVDTHCHWSPMGEWIVFSSTRSKPEDILLETDNGLDLGYFSVYLVKWNDKDVLVRVIRSGYDLAGHVNHPYFSPDGRSIVVASDLAGVSVDPISLPLFVHSVRSYGDIFSVDIDPTDINKNKDLKKFTRVTHSRYENSTATWTMSSIQELKSRWGQLLDTKASQICPYIPNGEGENIHMSGHLCLKHRCC